MILRGLITSAPVGTPPVTAQDPVDVGAPNGWSPVGVGGAWSALPSPSYAPVPLGTLTTTGNIDWTLGGLFTLTTTGSDALVLTFYTTASLAAGTNLPSFSAGQTIEILVYGTATATITWPATITWIGSLASTGGASASAPVFGAVNVSISLVCLTTGSAPTFIGTYLTS